MSAKRLERLRDALPHVQRVGVLRYQPAEVIDALRRHLERAADALKLMLHFFDVRSPEELESAFAAMAKAGVQAVVIHETPALNVARERIAQLAAKAHLPSIGIAL